MQPKPKINWFGVLMLLAAALMLLGDGFSLPFVSQKATAATFIYEKDQHVVPNPVLAAFDKLNREGGVIATVFEDDTTDGSETPEQYKVPLAAAKESGFPDAAYLVVTAGEKVLRVVKEPKTEEQVLEAVGK